MKDYHVIEKFVFCLLIAAFLYGCSNSYVDNIKRGEGFEYNPGHPEVRISASGFITPANEPKIIVSGDISYQSLVFSEEREQLKANVRINIEVLDITKNNKLIADTEFTTALFKDNAENLYADQDLHRFEKTLSVKPGQYLVRVAVQDLQSNKKTVRETQTHIPDPEGTKPGISEIRILSKNTDRDSTDFIPATAYDIPSKFDSLKFVFQVTNQQKGNSTSITSRLLKFRADTSIARPLHYSNYSSSSLSYKGIDYDKYEVIQTSTRQLEQTGSVLIEFVFSDLDRGNYRLETSLSDDNLDEELYRARDFSIKSHSYPSLSTPKELAAPLYYIMHEDEYEKLMALDSPDSIKRAIDQFWLSNINNSAKAKSVISLYYERVEQANKKFSNFKEGWKTDRGMIYILFGKPWYEDRFADRLEWYYSYNRQDPEKSFFFKRTKVNNKFFPFYNYILQRHRNYYNVYYNQKERWRSGLILKDNL